MLLYIIYAPSHPYTNTHTHTHTYTHTYTHTHKDIYQIKKYSNSASIIIFKLLTSDFLFNANRTNLNINFSLI